MQVKYDLSHQMGQLRKSEYKIKLKHAYKQIKKIKDIPILQFNINWNGLIDSDKKGIILKLIKCCFR